ncbi:F-box protein At3g07870-like [Papaver somniferum]|uniref:F-box protein At3g07870-like n=1 Tax=Papaver somniferum TaxID=3469 RepID=UPI000E704547|nr:F-box protein At3g07870-like [Papaver somniferum]
MAAENLPRDILENIFSRLFIKSTLQCKRVCKTWRRIIGNNVGLLFMFEKTRFGGRLIHLCYGDPKYETKIEKYYSLNTLESLVPNVNLKPDCMVGSCNGLVCYKAIDHSRSSEDSLGFICNNPITGEVAYIPGLENKGRSFKRPTGGFGYVGLTNEYKIVRIYFKYWGGIVQVYTLGSHLGWRDKGNVPPLSTLFSAKEPGVFANGALHWINGRDLILVFGLADEEFCFIPSPLYIYNNNWECSKFELILLGGNLCVVQKDYEFMNRRRLDIWVFKKKVTCDISTSCGKAKRKRRENYYDQTWSWSKEYSIEWEGQVSYTPFVITKLNTILLWENGTSDLYCYDPKTSMLQKYCAGDCPDYVYVQAIPHMNSLVSLKEIGET